jgi:propanol-preferring alcohol dehydrogenase
MAQIQSTSSGSPHTNEIPKMCKAGVVVNEGPNFHVEVTMVPVPEPKPDELLIRLSCTGVCYSDIHYMSGDLGRPPMSSYGIRSAGHEGAGVIVKLGSNVKESEWKVGDRVGIKPMWYVCGKCEVCWEGREQYCTKKVNAGCTVTGSFQQYSTLQNILFAFASTPILEY